MTIAAETTLDLAAAMSGWDRDDLEVQPVTGVQSLNNENWHVTSRSGEFAAVLRVPNTANDEWLGIDRAEEEAVARAAGVIGLGPEVIAADASGALLSRFIGGEPFDLETGHHVLDRLGRAIRALHTLDAAVASSRDIFGRISDLLQAAVELGGVQGDTAPYHAWLAEAREHRNAAGASPVIGHHDLWANNTLDDGDTLRLVDWEFSGLSDPVYDLAAVRIAIDTTRVDDATLLEVAGLDHLAEPSDLIRMTCAVHLFELAWAGIRSRLPAARDQGVAVAFDFVAHARAMREVVDGMLAQRQFTWSAP